MKIAKGMKVNAKVMNYNRGHSVVGVIDEVYTDGAYLPGNWYSLMVTDGDLSDAFVDFLVHERYTLIVPEKQIMEVISHES